MTCSHRKTIGRASLPNPMVCLKLIPDLGQEKRLGLFFQVDGNGSPATQETSSADMEKDSRCLLAAMRFQPPSPPAPLPQAGEGSLWNTLLWFVIWFSIVAAGRAEGSDEASLRLMRPDSLAGWEYGDQPPTGWRMENGVLHGSQGSTPLLSGYTFGEFRLRFAWSVEPGGAWEIAFPEVPSGPGLKIVLREGEGCGRLDDAGTIVAPGGKIDRLSDGMHKAQIDRSGGVLSLTIDGRAIWQTPLASGRRFGLGLALAAGEGRLSELCVNEPPGEPIFNGKDLTGWWTPGDKAAWSVQNGLLVVDREGGNYLRSEREYANFTLSLEYKIQRGGNSGVGIRTPRNGWPSGDGMEIQIWDLPRDKPLDKHAPGAIYGNVPPLARADRSGQFNRLVIKADGRMISAWINGHLVQQCYTGDHPELKHRRLAGWIGLQDHNSRTEFRDLRVLEAPAGLGLEAWRKPRPRRGPALLIDRLMNVEELARRDGIRGHVARARIEGPKPDGHVLAELAGPGAVVRLARTRDEGRLAFFFDGETSPRLECKPAELWQAAPLLAEDANPVLTCLAYRKGLKIVLRGISEGEWWIDYVAFPESLAVESYRAANPQIPPAWLAAAVYRHEQFGWGVHREYDPWPRPNSGPKTIQPGQRERMIRLDGAGIVHWTKLTADKQVLSNHDLWLEVRVDGETVPSVATPVRFWFPGLVGHGNYPNYVLLDRNGMTNMLAMPFAAGIELSLVNRGKKPIRVEGLSVSHEPLSADMGGDSQVRGAQAEPPIPPMRLRAVFEPGGKGGPALARCTSPGRWIGLVYEEPKGFSTSIESLAVDGSSLEGWKAAPLDILLGRGGDFHGCLSGRRGSLAWRYLLLEAVDFQRSFELSAGAARLGNRLAIFYCEPR